MKNKKIIMYISIIAIIIILISIGYIVYKNIKEKNNKIEYVPQEEITEEQLRQTIITLYFLNSDTCSLIPEARKIDSKELINNPYETLVNFLIEGPKNKKLLKLIPEQTNLISSEIKDDILILNFSEEFIKEQNLGKEQEELIIESIVNTVTQLTEVNKVKILINGEENKAFSDNEVTFEKVFVKK